MLVVVITAIYTTSTIRFDIIFFTCSLYLMLDSKLPNDAVDRLTHYINVYILDATHERAKSRESLMAEPKGNATLKAIAEEAGVTITTVSCILNNKGGKYAAKTKAKVQAIADRLKYRPNALATSVRTGKTGTAGVMIPNRHQFYSRVVSGIHDTLLNHDTLMLLCWNDDHPDGRTFGDKERRIIHGLVDRRVDGIILRPAHEDLDRSYFEEIWERGIPLILVDREMSNVTTDFAGTNDEVGGALAAEHLLFLGHRRMLYVGDSNISTSNHRQDGFLRVLTGTRDACGQAIEFYSWGANEQIVELITQQPDRATAVFCINDFIASQIMSLARDAGLSVPEDVSVVGFGDQSLPDAAVGLTTFNQSPAQIGAAAAQMYLDRVNAPGHTDYRTILIKPDLVVRGSTALAK